MDEEREEEIRSYFEACDANGDGTIQYAEFETLLHNLGADMGPDESRIGFREVDTDQDGCIDFKEFVSWWAEH